MKIGSQSCAIILHLFYNFLMGNFGRVMKVGKQQTNKQPNKKLEIVLIKICYDFLIAHIAIGNWLWFEASV